MVIALFILSLLTCLGRFIVPGHHLSWDGTYEAFAHIWVGFLLAVAILKPNHREFAVWLLVIITVLEVVMFFTK